MGEHLPCKQGVKSSNLSISIRQRKHRKLESRKSIQSHMYLENHIQKRFKISKDKTSEVVISKEVIIKEENLEKLTRTPVCNAIQTGRLSE